MAVGIIFSMYLVMGQITITSHKWTSFGNVIKRHSTLTNFILYTRLLEFVTMHDSILAAWIACSFQ